MLSEMVDRSNNNRPTAGIRVLVPQHLRGVGKLLEEYGRRLRQRHRGAKHHIKFDDVEKSLFLNIRLKEDKTWTRVYQETAENWVRQQRREEAASLNKRLSSLPIESPQSGFPSAAGPFQALAGTATTKKKTSTWTGGNASKLMESE